MKSINALTLAVLVLVLGNRTAIASVDLIARDVSVSVVTGFGDNLKEKTSNGSPVKSETGVFGAASLYAAARLTLGHLHQSDEYLLFSAEAFSVAEVEDRTKIPPGPVVASASAKGKFTFRVSDSPVFVEVLGQSGIDRFEITQANELLATNGVSQDPFRIGVGEFEVYVEEQSSRPGEISSLVIRTNPVPEPASLCTWILLSCMGAFGIVRRRSEQQ